MADAASLVERPPVPMWRDAGWRAVAAAFALNGLLFGGWASRVPAFKDRFDLDPALLGLLLLALAGGAIVSFPLAGALSEKWGADRLTVRCSWAYAPALVLLSLSPNVVTLGVTLFVFGAMHGAMDVAMNGWGARVEARIGKSTMSIFHAMFSFGAGVGAASGFLAVSLGLGPTPHFLFVAVLGGALALKAMIPAQEAGPRASPTNAAPLFALPTGQLLLIGLIAFSVSMGEGAMADWSAVFLRVAVEASDAEAALGYAAFSTSMVIVRLVGGRLVEWCGPVQTTRASTATAFTGLVIAILSNNLGLSLAGFALVGMGYAVVMPLVFSRAAHDPQMAAGPAIAAVATLGYGGMLLGPPLIGFVAQLTGLRLSFLVLAGLVLLACALAPKLRLQD